jgi:predicted lipoprotein with Yx(FWY)xxD motif
MYPRKKEDRMNKRMGKVVSGLVVVLVLAFTSLTWSQVAGGPDKPVIKVKAGLGNYLADGSGRTLYHFKKDAQDKNSCSGPCLEKWPVYYADPVTAPEGSDPKGFGSFTRVDGKKQSTYKGWPLYYFVGDKQPGDANGQGVKDVWYVVAPVNMEPCL